MTAMGFVIDKKFSKPTRAYVSSVIEYLKSEDLMNEVDSCSLNILCHYYEAFTTISNQIASDGYLIEKPNGEKVEHPLTKKLNEVEVQLFKILQEYGLTPLSRKRLKIEKNEIDNDPLSIFLNK